MLVTLQIMSLCFKNLNNCQKFTIVSLIPSFSWNHLSGKKGYWISLAQIIQSLLIKDLTNSITRCIDFNLDIMF